MDFNPFDLPGPPLPTQQFQEGGQVVTLRQATMEEVALYAHSPGQIPLITWQGEYWQIMPEGWEPGDPVK